ncbi:hypothetical protein BGP_4553 [Beggiatoa sp. PS]|nr:hypothetical protein BGP_4553 [Beggiatoa sp. PS]
MVQSSWLFLSQYLRCMRLFLLWGNQCNFNDRFFKPLEASVVWVEQSEPPHPNVVRLNLIDDGFHFRSTGLLHSSFNL